MYVADFATGPVALAPAQAEALAPALSAVERTTIAIARMEADRKRWNARLARTGIARAIGRTFRTLTGLRTVTRLADDRLEALREFVALARLGDRREVDAAVRLIELGFRIDSVAAARAMARG